MELALVTGTVVCSVKDANMPAEKLLLLQPLTTALRAKGDELVATDVTGAGVGEVVLYAKGSSARQTAATENKPVDGLVIGIVDELELHGKLAFRRGQDEPALADIEQQLAGKK